MLNAMFFSTLGYRTLTAMFRFFRLFWVLFPIHSLTLSICICLILGQFFSQILVCTTTNICLHAIGRLMFLVKCEWIVFLKWQMHKVTLTQAKKKYVILSQFFPSISSVHSYKHTFKCHRCTNVFSKVCKNIFLMLTHA